MQTDNRDFKYVLQDAGKIYIGARYTYREMMEEDMVPFKFKAIINHYMLPENLADTPIAEHIFTLKKTDMSYFAYHQLKARFRLNVYGWAGEAGRKKDGYQSRYYTMEEIAENGELSQRQLVVEELMFSKLSLMMLQV